MVMSEEALPNGHDMLKGNTASKRLAMSEKIWGQSLDKVESWLKKETEQAKLKSEDIEAHLCDSEELEAFKKNPSRRTLPGLPRTQTVQRQNSERRDRLCPHEPDAQERRANSMDRRAIATYLDPISSGTLQAQPSHSAPNVGVSSFIPEPQLDSQEKRSIETETNEVLEDSSLERVPSISLDSNHDDQEKLLIQNELDAKWVLNLSMHFKDRSEREKFFVTYAEKPNKWRRLTISIDYRNATEDSLEADLKHLQYQREKSARVFESIRESLPDIQFYSTVTNLKLKTIDGRLHIHCSEDVNEIIKYPHISLLAHIPYPVYKESEVLYQAHMSGYVYRVSVDTQVLVKKEIPGPDAVDEFIYEANALSVLKGSQNVIEFHGLVIDDEEHLIKGLLIKHASRGALVDIIYDAKFAKHPVSWSQREYWARQVVNGLSEIHEAGFVQGDFTLSNIVVDGDDNISLIDINRRGCPVGWEPPELMTMIKSGQRISMFIGVKTDLFQLGMVLWAIAMMVDEPEREPKPLREINEPEVPRYFQEIVTICLQMDPRRRVSARDLLKRFPPTIQQSATHAGMVESYPVLVDGTHFQNSRLPLHYSSGPIYVDPSAPSECYFDSRDSGIVQDEAKDASPLMKFDDDEPISTDFDPFAVKPDDSPTSDVPILEENEQAQPQERVESDTHSPSGLGSITPRPPSCNTQQEKLVELIAGDEPRNIPERQSPLRPNHHDTLM